MKGSCCESYVEIFPDNFSIFPDDEEETLSDNPPVPLPERPSSWA